MMAIRLYSLYRSYGYTKMSSAKMALQVYRKNVKRARYAIFLTKDIGQAVDQGISILTIYGQSI